MYVVVMWYRERIKVLLNHLCIEVVTDSVNEESAPDDGSAVMWGLRRGGGGRVVACDWGLDSARVTVLTHTPVYSCTVNCTFLRPPSATVIPRPAGS